MSDTSRSKSLKPVHQLDGPDSHADGTDLSLVSDSGTQVDMMIREAFLEALFDAVTSPTSPALGPLVKRMTEAGIAAREIADVFIPELARKLGAMWCEDDIGFATVTIGVARLQGLLREIGPEWRADEFRNGDAPGLLVVVGSGVFHTLGATVLTGQLRRSGLSVRLLIDATPESLGPVMRKARFDAVLISASDSENLESLRRLVLAVKRATSVPPPVVIGGIIVDQLQAQGVDIAALTGADFVTRDANEALALCGLSSFLISGPMSAHGL